MEAENLQQSTRFIASNACFETKLPFLLVSFERFQVNSYASACNLMIISLGSPPVCLVGFMFVIFLVFYVVFLFVFVLCLVPNVALFLGCPFLIAPLVFSKICVVLYTSWPKVNVYVICINNHIIESSFGTTE